MLAEFDRCAREGTPRPESQAIRAHVPAVFWSFANSWRDVFKNGVADHAIKELCRIYVSRSVLCEFCGNQRSIKAAKAGVVEDDYRDLINFESSTRYSEKQKARLAYAEAITWDLPTDDAFWARLHKHFSEPELVEIGYFRRAHHGPAALAAHAEHRAPPGARRHRCLDGAGLRDAWSAEDLETAGRLLGEETGCARSSGRVVEPSPRGASLRAAKVGVSKGEGACTILGHASRRAAAPRSSA
jgi:alkylhydroperoxidase family enzyme